MKCPHCNTEIHGNPTFSFLTKDIDGFWGIEQHVCPSCGRAFFFLECSETPVRRDVKISMLGYPKAFNRPLPPEEVPSEFAADYREASDVLEISPKASAALSRRCLQNILREKANVKPSDLSQEISEVLSKNILPAHLAGAVDAIRNIGNFAAHPMKSKATGEILSVESGEAEWTLDVLDGLFDFFFVQPELLKNRRAALDKKLAAAGKPPIK